MSTMMQNGSGSTAESQDDESRIKSLSELRSLWEGMASKNERSLKPDGQKKPQLVRGDRSRQMETAQKSSTSSLATVSVARTTPTSSVATATFSLVTPLSSTTKGKSPVTTPVSGMVNAPSFNTTTRSSMTTPGIPMTTQASSTTTPSSSMIKPANHRATPPNSITTEASSVARTTSSTSTSGVLTNGKNSFRSNRTSQEPGKGNIRFESQATGRDQVPQNKEASIESKDQVHINREPQIKTYPTEASRFFPEATLTAVAPSGDGDSSQPRVVRGSILVRNSIDMIGWPRLLDVVETSDSDEGIVVEENTNLFHGRYFQLRENPLYFSDHEDLDEVEDREDRSKTHRDKAKAGKYLGSGDGGPEGKMVSTLNMEKPQNVRPLLAQNQQDKDATSSNGNGSSSRSSLPFAADRCVKVDGPNRSEILRLVDDGSDGARQTVTVERTEEELTKEMMEALQVSGDPSKGVTNVDVVEERLDVELSNGLAQVKVTVHCERIVPNRLSGQSYRKSSVTVIRTTEVDMLATPERRQIYERVVDRYGTPEQEVSRANALVHRNKLSTDDVYALYRVFVEVTGRSRSIAADPGNQMMTSLSKTEVAGLELLSGQSLPLSLLRLGPLISPVSLIQWTQ